LGAKDGDVPRVPGAVEDADGDQRGEGRSMTSTASSIASLGEAELRLEGLGRSSSSVLEVLVRSVAKQDETRGSGGAPEEREAGRRERRDACSPESPESSGKACREGGFRQGIASV
jgi:hypothetical protein